MERLESNHPISGLERMYIYFVYNFGDFPRPTRDSENLGGAA